MIEKSWTINEHKPCLCDCHRDGCNLMHIMPCCGLCGQKYIETDGNFNNDRFQAAMREFVVKNEKRKPRWTPEERMRRWREGTGKE